MLEIIDKDTPVTVFIGEDSQRSLSERVANFLPRICGKYNIIDTKKFELKGISPEYRGYISHLVMHAVTQRIDAHMEKSIVILWKSEDITDVWTIKVAKWTER